MRPGQAKGPSVTKTGGGGLASVSTSDTNTIDFTGDGTGGSPLEADLKISANAGNSATAVADGLYVPPVGISTVNVGDTDSIDLNGNGVGAAILGSVKLSNLNRNDLAINAAGGGGLTAGMWSQHSPVHSFDGNRLDATKIGLFEVTFPLGVQMAGRYLVTLASQSWDFDLMIGISLYSSGVSQITVLHGCINYLNQQIVSDFEVRTDGRTMKVLALSALGLLPVLHYAVGVTELKQPSYLPVVGDPFNANACYPSVFGTYSGVLENHRTNWVPFGSPNAPAASKLWGTDGAGVLGWQPTPPTGMANPMTTQGDIIVGGVGGAPVRVGAGVAGYAWISNGPGVAPSYQAIVGNGSAVISATVETFPIGLAGNAPLGISIPLWTSIFATATFTPTKVFVHFPNTAGAAANTTIVVMEQDAASPFGMTCRGKGTFAVPAATAGFYAIAVAFQANFKITAGKVYWVGVQEPLGVRQVAANSGLLNPNTLGAVGGQVTPTTTPASAYLTDYVAGTTVIAGANRPNDGSRVWARISE